MRLVILIPFSTSRAEHKDLTQVEQHKTKCTSSTGNQSQDHMLCNHGQCSRTCTGTLILQHNQMMTETTMGSRKFQEFRWKLTLTCQHLYHCAHQQQCHKENVYPLHSEEISFKFIQSKQSNSIQIELVTENKIHTIVVANLELASIISCKTF